MPGKWGARIFGAVAVKETLQTVSESYKTDAVWVVGTPVEYSVYVELGTSRMAAQPYLRPAVEQVGRNIGEYFKEAESLAEALSLIALAIEAIAKRHCPVDTGNLRSSIAADRVK